MTDSQILYAPSMKFEEYIFKKKFTIMIPAYNEERRIRPVINEIISFISENRLDWNIVVSIDGNDKTEEIVKEYCDNHSNVYYIKNFGRSGKGNAVRRVSNILDSEYVILMDADGSISFASLVGHLYLLNQYDAIVYSRYLFKNNIPFIRLFFSRGFNLLVRAFLGLNISDTQTGYKAFRTDIYLKSLRATTVSNGFYDVALLWHTKHNGGRIVEVPVNYHHMNGSKFHILSTTITFWISLHAFIIRHSRFYKYVPKKFVDLYYRKFKWI